MNMDRPSVILAFAIFALFVANIAFSGLSYLYPIQQLIGLNLLGLASALAFFLAYAWRNKTHKIKTVINLYILIAIIILFILISFQLIGIAVVITLAGLYIIALMSKRLKSYHFYFAAALVLIVTSAFAYISFSGLRGAKWRGIDEIGFNYYAGYLLLHGINPYKANMQPILTQYNTPPTYLLNGMNQTAYDYPALSFLSVIFLPLFNIRSFLSSIALLVFVCTLAAFIIYRSSNYNKFVLIPVTIWLISTYFIVVATAHYLAISIFLLIAYMQRKNILLSAIFLGLAASTIQLAWFAIPFFYILTLRESGSKSAIKSILVTLAVFLLVNSYFIIAAPLYFFNNVFGIFGTAKLILYGPNISQILLYYYSVTLWYSAAISIITLLSLMALFYIYTNTLKLLIAVAPAFIFFLSWRNLPMYGLAFVPLIIVICYLKEKREVKDLTKEKRYIPATLAVVAILAILLAVYSHNIYTKQNTLVINSLSPVLQRVISTRSIYKFNVVKLNVTNNGNSYESVSFLLTGPYPTNETITLGPNLNSIAPHSSQNYTLLLSVNNITKNTSINVLAFSKDYILDKTFHINATKATAQSG